MAPTFSIVIPTYRRGTLLRRMLPSYISTDPLEVIVVDDGSGRMDQPALQSAAEVPRVELIHLPHRGTAAARNEGVRRAQGDWIVFGEDDVWFTPEYPTTLIDHSIRAAALAASGCAPLMDPALLSGSREELEELIRSTPMVDRPPDKLLGVQWPVERLESGDVLTPLLTAVAAVIGRFSSECCSIPGSEAMPSGRRPTSSSRAWRRASGPSTALMRRAAT